MPTTTEQSDGAGTLSSAAEDPFEDCSLDTRVARRPGYVYDERMLAHRPGRKQMEVPGRLIAIHEACAPLLEQCTVVEAERACREDLLRVHSAEYLNRLSDACTLVAETDDVYKFDGDDTVASAGTGTAALLAAGSTVALATMVAAGELTSGFAVVRPPGHHACPCDPMGFCFLNNVAIAALKLVDEFGMRVCVLDW